MSRRRARAVRTCWTDMGPMSSAARMAPASTATTRSEMCGSSKCALQAGTLSLNRTVFTHHQRAGPATHRADLTAVNAAGLRLAFDVSLTGLAHQLVALETAKLHVYGVNQAAACLASGERFYPLGMHARTGHFGPSAVE
eukprot:6490525-Amphidinium_carterae.2